MTADTPAAAARALILLFRENAIPMSDRNSFLYTILEDALSAPVAAPPADPLLGQALQALVRYANACDADAPTVAVIQALEARIDAAPPAASGVEWVERAMELAEELETAAILYGASEPDSDEERDCRERRLAARDSLRTHLSTALTGAAKDMK